MADNAKDGKSLYLEFAGVVIDTDYREFDPGLTEVNTDKTAGADALTSTHKLRDTVIPTLSILLKDSVASEAIATALAHGATGNLIWGPDGNTAGEPKWGIEARVVSNVAQSFNAETMMDVTFENNGTDWLFDGRTDTF